MDKNEANFIHYTEKIVYFLTSTLSIYLFFNTLNISII